MSDPISGTRRMPRFMQPGCGLLWLLLLGPVWLSCDSGTDPGREAGTDPGPEVRIDFDFPGASLAYAQSLGGDTFRIGLKDDTNATTKLWFSFRVQEAQGRTLTFRLDNAATAQKPTAVIDAVSEYYRTSNANIHRGVHTLSIEATEAYVPSGYPVGAEAILLVELDGPASEVEHLIGVTEGILRNAGATEIRISGSEEERLRFWAGRKAAFPAMGRISPDYYCMDGTIPRSALPKVLGRIRELSRAYGLRVANVFHAGDGNLHPLVLYDSNVPGELEKTERMGTEILKLCVDVGGVLTGEHGVGIEKRDLMTYQFGENDLDAMQRVKCSFDAGQLLNPGKMFPVLRRCAELGRMHVHAGKIPFPELERF
ncbi:MAG: aminotransferase class V-fold PLP-dependent enzyme [SAR324 cluster bacterium]|nr:aminotransferase class V-fold PLP-dependent enzyme [SAR324 cluster bacterium]